MKTIKEVLMERDGKSEAEADDLIKEARDDFYSRLEEGDLTAEYICEEYFGLEPDYLEEFF